MTATIPRKIHRIWIDGSPPVPQHYISNTACWREFHPNWEIKTWGGPEGFRMQNRCMYRDPPTSNSHDRLRARADLLRLEILYRFGGVYVDMDIESLRAIDKLVAMAQPGEALAAHSPNRYQGRLILSNAFIAAPAGHPWILRCIAKMRVSSQAFAGKFLAMVTGPHHVNRCLKLNDLVRIIPTGLVYPISRDELPGAFMFHSWETRAKLRREKLA